jgi:hypothetical protein
MIQGKRVLDVKWIYIKKSDGRYKSRLKTDVINDIYSPVAKKANVKDIIISLL